MKITATNKATGEVVELSVDNPEEIVQAWQTAQEYEKTSKTSKTLKDQLKKLVPEFVGDRGTSEPIGNFQFRVSNIQRMNYDKAIMRYVFDADTFDLLLDPNKPAVDKYLKEHLDELGPDSTKLRETMIPVGNPYQVIKLERLS